MRISKRAVDRAEPKASAYTLWDSDIPGFGVKIHPTGRKTYVFKYRVGGGRGGRRREPALGTHGAITPDQARQLALSWARDVAVGLDPAGARDTVRNAPTMDALFDRYLSDHAQKHKKASSLRNDIRLIDKRLRGVFGRLKVQDVRRDDVLKLHGALHATPYEANRTLALLSKVFNLAELWELRDDGTNPCRHVKKYKEQKRERLISDQELARLGSVLAQAELEPLIDQGGSLQAMYPPAISALRLLLFTGARLNEVLSLEWAWINWAQARAELPDSKTGQKFIYFPPAAVAVLEKIASACPDATYVIKGKYPGTHLVNLKDTWRVVRFNAELEDVRLHDLRHCFASVGAMQGMSLPIIGALLGHKDTATTQRYAHLSDNPVRTASEEIGGRLEQLLSGTPI